MSQIDQFQHLKIKLDAIRSATNNFCVDNFIGSGGFGKVYRGEVGHSNGETMVALKRLDRKFGQGNSEFWKEIIMLSFYKHENIVSLLGYCDDHGEKILVYEYASRKSLDTYLTNDDLSWIQRLKICIGAARGLAYLHNPAHTRVRILHRDIKSSNILLDDNWNAKISDFGLSKVAPANTQFTYLVSNPAGTIGYIDPLYQETGFLTKESDVYSFGVVLFEVLCGRLCYNKYSRPLIGLVEECHEQNKMHELVYDGIKDEVNISSLTMFTKIAYQCLRKKRSERPLMTQIVRALERALHNQEYEGAGILNVKVHGTTDGQKPFDASNHYLILGIGLFGPLQNIKMTGKYKEVNSEWNEEFTLYVEDFYAQNLSLRVNKVVSENRHDHMGNARLVLRDLTPEMPLICDLRVVDEDENHNGDIKIEVLYKAANIEDLLGSVQKAPIGTPKDGGVLVVIIHRAHFVLKKQKHSSVSLLFRGELRKTQSIMNTNNPMWLQEFRFTLDQPPTTEEYLSLEVNDDSWKGLFSGRGSIGFTTISLTDVIQKKWINREYKLEPYYAVGYFDHKYIHLKVELQWRTSD